MKGFKDTHDFVGVLGIEIAGGLVSQHDGGSVDNGARRCTGVVVRRRIMRWDWPFRAVTVQLYQVRVGSLDVFTMIEAADLQRQYHVVKHATVEQ